jgi:hypothetical protein
MKRLFLFLKWLASQSPESIEAMAWARLDCEEHLERCLFIGSEEHLELCLTLESKVVYPRKPNGY